MLTGCLGKLATFRRFAGGSTLIVDFASVFLRLEELAGAADDSAVDAAAVAPSIETAGEGGADMAGSSERRLYLFFRFLYIGIDDSEAVTRSGERCTERCERGAILTMLGSDVDAEGCISADESSGGTCSDTVSSTMCATGGTG